MSFEETMNNCKRCTFFVKSGPFPDMGLCRVEPPKITPNSENYCGLGLEGLFPAVSCSDWCGRFKAQRKATPRKGSL